MESVSVTLKNVCKEFTDRSRKAGISLAVDNVSLYIPKGSFTTLLGPSGCGKTTTLRMIAGFESPTSGDILFDEKSMIQVPPQRRDAAMVFQSYALFPHMSVFENIAFGLKIRKVPQENMKSRVKHVLENVGLLGFENRLPGQLSGGQQQRVALARALVVEPRVLLFDEPLSNLDAKLRLQMRAEIKKIVKQLGITAVYVTHDQEEAMVLSDKIVVMNKGKVEQEGGPEETYSKPKTVFVANFVGRANLIPGEVKGKNGAFFSVAAFGKTFQIQSNENVQNGDSVLLLLRPEAVSLVSPETGIFSGKILSKMYMGSFFYYEISVNGHVLDVESSGGGHAEDEIVGLAFSMDFLHLLREKP